MRIKTVSCWRHRARTSPSRFRWHSSSPCSRQSRCKHYPIPGTPSRWRGVSLKVTAVPWLKLAEQAPPLPQLIPVGELVTVPGPSSLTERVYVVVVPTLTAIDAEGMPFATTTSSLGPVSMLDGTSKLAVELLLSAIDKLLKLEVLA